MVCGRSRFGKTEWARSLGRHVHMQQLFNIEQWDSEAQYLVVDDVHFTKFEHVRQSLWGAQKHFNLTGKWRKHFPVSWGKPMIYLCNKGNDFRTLRKKNGEMYLDYWELEWYLDNTVIVDLTEPLFVVSANALDDEQGVAAVRQLEIDEEDL